MTTTAITYKSDRYGFPLENCSRCDGTGYLHEYRHVMGGQCAKCSGGKHHYPQGKAGDIARAFRTELRSQTRASAADLQPGDVVEWYGEWKTVQAVLPTCQWRGATTLGDPGTPGYSDINRYAVIISFTDGTLDEDSGCMLKRRPKITADEVRTAVQASRTAYERLLARRIQRETREAIERENAKARAQAERNLDEMAPLHAVWEQRGDLIADMYPEIHESAMVAIAATEEFWQEDARWRQAVTNCRRNANATGY